MNRWSHLCLCIFVVVSGCASRAPKDPLAQYYYLNPGTDVRRVGPTVLLQLNNHSDFSRVSADATDALFQALQQKGLLGMSQIRTDDSQWQTLELDKFGHHTLEQISAVQSTLNCNSVLHGSVTKFTPYPHLAVGLRLKLIDLQSGVVHWAFEYIWDTADEAVQDRLEEFYTQRNILGLASSRDRLGAVSSIKLLKFVAYETSQTLGPIK